MAALAGTIQLFTRIVCRGQVYEILYNNAISTKEGTVSNLRNALVDLYVSAIQLLAQSGTLFESGIVRQTLNTILRPEQAAGLISDLLEKERMLSYEVQSYEALRNEEATKQIDEGLRNVLAKLDVISSPLTRIDGGVAKLLENVNDYQLEKIMDFISSEQFGRGHATIKDTRIKNTGDWLINHESFQDWQCIASSSTLLCLQGTGRLLLVQRLISIAIFESNTQQLVPARHISHLVSLIMLNKHWKHLHMTKDLPFSIAPDLDRQCKIPLPSSAASCVSYPIRQTIIAVSKARSYKDAA